MRIFQLTRQGVVLNLDNAESRRAVEHCYRTTSTLVNPIIDWTDSDVWELLHHYGCEGNPLYQCGFHRIGCIGCPLAGHKHQQKILHAIQNIKRYTSKHLIEWCRLEKNMGKAAILGDPAQMLCTGGFRKIQIRDNSSRMTKSMKL